MTKEERKIYREMEKRYGLYIDEMESVLQGCMVFVDDDLNRVYFRGWEWERGRLKLPGTADCIWNGRI